MDPKRQFDLVVRVIEDISEGDVEKAESHREVFSLLNESFDVI